MHALDADLLALQEVRDHMRRAVAAQKAIAGSGQEETDRLCKAMSEAAARAAGDLARLAVSETGIGRASSKVLKNLFAAEGIWKSIEKERTVGILRKDEAAGVVEVAMPIGVVAGIVPTTNPTSTAIGKALIAVKGRNAIVVSPHPRAKRCIAETCEVLRRAIERAGGPPDLVQCLSRPTLESTEALMRHDDLKLILATGGSGLVKAAYSSGKPAFGVGPGNVPVYVDRSADLRKAAHWIVRSQQFDFATLCCSEQALVLDAPIAERMLGFLREAGAHVCDPEQTAKLERFANRGGHMNPDLVGLDPRQVARKAGFEVPASTKLLLAHQGGVGPEFPLSIEILCPLLSVHRVDGWKEGCRTSFAILENGGLGHTIGVWSEDSTVLEAWYVEKPASRIVANGPTSQGAVGYSTGLVPSMSLGCGPLAGNITSDNISARHMIHVKRVGLLRSGFEEQFERDTARAARILGEPAPELAGRPVVPSSWRPAPTSSSAAPAPTTVPTPAVPKPGAGATWNAAPRPGAGRPAPAWSGARTTSSDSPQRSEPQSATLPPPAFASASCPLGPCSGCPHQDVRTGSCTA